MYTKIASLSLNEEKKSNYASKIFLAEPSPVQENLAGRLFILLEVEAKKNDAKKIIDFIISDINDNYYQNEKIKLREKIDTLKIENIFETVLVKTNKNLIDFLAQERIALSSRSINATIGIIYDHWLHFSNIGKNQALLLYKEEGESEYRMINIEKTQEDKSGEESDSLSFKKLFSSIVSGEMPAKSYFLFANETLSQYLFNKELIEITTKLNPNSAAEQIKNTLARINSFVPFLGIIIKNNLYKPEEEHVDDHHLRHVLHQEEKSYHQNNGHQAINGLRDTQEKTQEILSAGEVVSSKKIGGACKKALRSINIFRWLYLLLKLIFKKRREKTLNTSPSLEKEAYISQNAPRKGRRKAIIYIFILLALIFAASLFWQKNRVEKVAQEETSQSLEESIKQKESQIDSYLLYNNEEPAKVILNELKEIFAGLNDENKAQIADFNSLYKKYEELEARLMHVTKVDNLKELINFNHLNETSQPDSLEVSFVGAERKIYAANSQDKTIYKINAEQKLTSIINSEGVKESLKYSLLDKDGNIHYLDKGQLVNLDIKSDKLNYTNFQAGDNKEIIDIGLYNGRLYALDKSSSQIYRYSAGATGFEKGEARIKDKLDLNGLKSMAVDIYGAKSYIYLLKETGEVIKLYDGLQENFKLDTVEPVLNSAEKILVRSNLYILDKNNKRLVVFDSNGKFIKQYQSDNLNNLKDAAVDEKNKRAYLLNGGSVYELEL